MEVQISSMFLQPANCVKVYLKMGETRGCDIMPINRLAALRPLDVRRAGPNSFVTLREGLVHPGCLRRLGTFHQSV